MREAILIAVAVILLTAFWTVSAIAPYGTQQQKLSESYNDITAIMEAVRAREFIATINPYLTNHEVDKLLATFLRISREYEIELDLLLSVAASESHFRTDAISRAGCIGIMQLKPSTALILGVDPAELTDPVINIDAGARYLRLLLDRYEDIELAVSAYNAGPTRVGNKVPAIKETREYVTRVAGHREVLARWNVDGARN